METCGEEGKGNVNSFPMVSNSSSFVGLTKAWDKNRRERLRPLKCSADWRSLSDLLESGVLVHRKRRADYVERRVDGYVEPSDIFIVGTCHHSAKSAQDVTRVVNAIKPETVVVELCRSRSGMLYGQESEMGLSGERKEDFFGVLWRSLRLGGGGSLFAQFLLARAGRKDSGVDFRASQKAAKKVGAELVLGDRPIEITLKRALASLSLLDRLWFAIVLVRQIRDRQKLGSQVESTTMMQNVDSTLLLMSREYPQLYKPLVEERDMYLTWSLKRSKAVNGRKAVVGVVGAGHVPGILAAIDSDAGNNGSTLTFKDLVAVPDEPPLTQRIAKRLAIDTVLFLCLLQLLR
ncbi:hypothetical protein NDN08_006989 [Rhodosorus marinus]|uniref:TraB domain-containing protein n=1 Tax=Rhodosorus marinus TaxID=101924 RepID=A0AAV8UND5_9RHOD|nr:hypothetical protein NDN08_006989 [Rhodosorus marinus]